MKNTNSAMRKLPYNVKGLLPLDDGYHIVSTDGVNLLAKRSHKRKANIREFEQWIMDQVVPDLQKKGPLPAKDEKDDVILNDTIGRSQVNTVVSEAGLYKLIMRSRKATAEKFIDWIAHEVLPTIRKTGAYVTDDTMHKIEQDPEYMSKVLDEIQTLKLERDAARTKGHHINDKRTATAMGRLGATTKKIRRLEESAGRLLTKVGQLTTEVGHLETEVEYLEDDTLATRPMAVCEIDWIFKYFSNNRPASMHRIIGEELTHLFEPQSIRAIITVAYISKVFVMALRLFIILLIVSPG